MTYAVTNDLVALRADITSHGVSDWSAHIAFAEADVVERIKSEWFPMAARSNYGYGLALTDYQIIQDAFDVSKLNAAALKNLVCFRAMAAYIYPSLTRDVDDGEDAYSRRALRYAERYEEEWAKCRAIALYDFNSDATFSALERQEPVRTVRVSRA